MKRSLLLATACVLMVCTPVAAETLKCSGSTTIASIVFTSAIKQNIKNIIGIDIDLVGSSSGSEFTDLMGGKVSCVMSTAHLKDLLTHNNITDASSFKEWNLGRDTVVAIVHRHNAVKTTSLTKEEWATLFSGKTRNWSEVGGPLMPVVVFIPADESGATRHDVQEYVMGGAAYSSNAKKTIIDIDDVAAVGATFGGLGAVRKSLASANPAVAIMDDPLLTREIVLITKTDAPSGFDKLIAYLTSPDVKARLGIE